MKDRYFGDVYDYIKYSLLRQLANSKGASTAVCWMLTEDEGGKDGHRTHYLRKPDEWRSFEPTVFDFLRRQVLERKNRRVRAIEKSSVLRHCRFYSKVLTDDRVQRERYFHEFLPFAHGTDLVFFDPDNGVEVRSVKYGRRKSAKYLYWNEIESTIRANHSVLIYQHLPPQPHGPLIRSLAMRLLRSSRSGVVYSIRTGRVAFFLVPRRGARSHFQKRVSMVGKSWDSVLTVREYRRS